MPRTNRPGWLFRGLALWVFPASLGVRAIVHGSLTGTILDPSGGPVPNAKVTLADVDRSTRNAAQTDRSGRYVFRSLSPGKYSVVVEAAGFDSYELRDIVIQVNSDLSADAKLRVASRRESVVVEADASPLQQENATMGLVLDRESVNDLPLVSRNPFDLAFLAPGVSQAQGTDLWQRRQHPGIRHEFRLRRQPQRSGRFAARRL